MPNMRKKRQHKVVLIHDFLLYIGGAERNLLNFLHAFPQADLYFTFIIFNRQTKQYIRQLRKQFPEVVIHTSSMQQWPLLRQLYRLYKFLTPWVAETMPLHKYSTIVYQTSFLSKGFLAQPHQQVLLYINTPFRWLWGLPTARLSLISWIPKTVRELWSMTLRQWDWLASKRATAIVANSGAVRKRIERFYQEKAAVVWPAIDYKLFIKRAAQAKEVISSGLLSSLHIPNTKPLLVMVDRLDLYKNHHLAIKAFDEHPPLQQYHLAIIGDGTEYPELEAQLSRTTHSLELFRWKGMLITHTPQVTIIRRCPDSIRDKLRIHALALLNLTEEDFGLGMAETLALGKPVIAYYRGGAADIVRHEQNGLLLQEQSGAAISQALNLLQELQQRKVITPQNCQHSAERFDRTHFIHKLHTLVQHE